MGANADSFYKTCEGIEGRAVGLAARISAPLAGLNAFGGGLLGGASGAMLALTNPLTGIMSMAANLGGGSMAATASGLTNLTESTNNAVERLSNLNNASKKVGLAPEFLRSLQIAAGPAGDDIDKMMVKFDKFINKLRVGERDLTSNKTMQDKYGGILDLDTIIGGSKEQAVRSFIDSLSGIGDKTQRNAVLMEAWGKSGAEAFKIFEGKLPEIEDMVHATGKASERNLAAAAEIKALRKELKLLKEDAENRALRGPGTFAEYAEHAGSMGDWGNWFGWKSKQYFSAMFGVSAAKMGYAPRPHPTEPEVDHSAEIEAELLRARQEEFEKQTKTLRATLYSPQERYAAEALKYGVSGLNEAMVNKGLDKAFSESFGVESAIAQARQQLTAVNRNPGLALAGSQDFFAAIDAAMNQKSEPDQKQLLEATNQILKDNETARTQRQDLIRAVREANAPTVVTLPQ